MAANLFAPKRAGTQAAAEVFWRQAAVVPRRVAGRLRHEVELARGLWRRAAGDGEGPLATIRCQGVSRSGRRRTLAFLGRAALAPDFDFLFDGPVARQTLAHGTLWTLPILRRRALTVNADVAVTEQLWRPDMDAQEFAYATHLESSLQVGESWTAQVQRMPKSALRRHHEGALEPTLSFHATQQVGDFDAFYALMYEPVDRGRFGDTSATLPADAMRATFARQGTLLKIYDADAWVSAVIVLAGTGAADLRVWRFGIADADDLNSDQLERLTRFHDRAVIDHARSRGARVVDFGISRAVADNPVFRRKRDLGCSFRVAGRSPLYRMRVRERARGELVDEGILLVPRAGGPTLLNRLDLGVGQR